MLQLLCEGNNVKMKNFLRFQPIPGGKSDVYDNPLSINFILFSAEIYRSMKTFFNDKCIDILNRLLDLINEVC